nr:hypothetical protein [Tanacetum cinerariifolium]
LSLTWLALLFPGRDLLCIQLSLLMAKYSLVWGSPGVPTTNNSEEDDDILGLSSKGKEIIGSPISGLKRRRFGDSDGRASSPFIIGRHVGFVGPLVNFEEDVDLDRFLLGNAEARESHDILSGLDQPKFKRRLDGLSLTELANFHDVSAMKLVMSITMLNREARSLLVDASRLRYEVFKLRLEQLKSATTIARLKAELLCVKGKSLTYEVGSVRDLKTKNEKLVKDISSLRELSRLVESSKKILEVDVETLRSRALMVTDLLPHVVKTLISCDSFSTLLADLQRKAILVSRAQAFEEVTSMGLAFQLENVKDYDPDSTKAYDKAVDVFYHVEFPYLDLLAYHSKRSLGVLKSLEPLSLPLHKSSGAGPSSSLFI